MSAGTLYAGDGVVIQHALMSPHPCVSTLRYPRSSFSYGNMSLCVCSHSLFALFVLLDFSFFCSLWSRVESSTSPPRPLFRPAARSVHGQSADNESPYIVEYGHITINVTSNGSIIHDYAPSMVHVTDEELLIHITLHRPLGDENPITLYAVRRLKIELPPSNASFGMTPMEPNVHRGFPVSFGFFANKSAPVDFSCVELDLSSMMGAKPAQPAVLSMTHVTCRNSCCADHRLPWHH